MFYPSAFSSFVLLSCVYYLKIAIDLFFSPGFFFFFLMDDVAAAVGFFFFKKKVTGTILAPHQK